MEQSSEKPHIRFLSFSNDKEDAEKEAKLKEAATKIEQAIARDKSLSELIDYQPASSTNELTDSANDTRPLYERLQERKNQKKESIEESQKLSNLVATLDEEDVNYLNEVARNKYEEEIKKRLEVHDALELKKKSNEKRVEEKEKRMKESLMSSKLNFKSIDLKSKISHLKIKPRTKETSSIHSSTSILDLGSLISKSTVQPTCSLSILEHTKSANSELEDKEDVKRHKCVDTQNTTCSFRED